MHRACVSFTKRMDCSTCQCLWIKKTPVPLQCCRNRWIYVDSLWHASVLMASSLYTETLLLGIYITLNVMLINANQLMGNTEVWKKCVFNFPVYNSLIRQGKQATAIGTTEVPLVDRRWALILGRSHGRQRVLIESKRVIGAWTGYVKYGPANPMMRGAIVSYMTESQHL